MKTKNVLTETKKRLEQIRDKKRRETSVVDDKLAKLRDEQAKLLKEQEQASDDMNLDRYAELSEKLNTISTAVSMYEAKKASLTSVTDITADESDKTIDALIAYQDDLARQFLSAIAGPMEQIEKAITDYDIDLVDLRNTIASWQAETRLGYRGGQIIPTFIGCGESRIIRESVNRLRELRKITKR